MELTVAGRNAYAYTGGKPFDAKLPSVAFIHGGAHDHSVWILQSRYLAHHGFGVLALDLPGHGRSEGKALGKIGDIADWIGAALDAAGAKSAALIGHSMGSLAALDFAARHAGRATRIALLGAAFPMRVSPELLEATRDDEPRAHQMINVWSHAASAHFPSNPGPGFWVVGENLRLMQRQKRGVLHTDFAACNDYAAGIERARQIACPALFIVGRRDAMTPPRAVRDLVAAIPGAKTVLLDECGHNSMAEKPDEVLDALLEFLDVA